MKKKAAGNRAEIMHPSLLPLAVDEIDLVRIESNLLQIGFFSARDTRRKERNSERVLERWVNRNGQRIKERIEFRSSALHGLPTTADRDKYLALMKIVYDDRAKTGTIANPIRFSGYRLLQELNLTDSGHNYDDIATWLKRMTDTSISSEKVVYLAARKRYTDSTIKVFRSAKRVGSSKHDGSDRIETYEVHLEDWLIENLNHNYVVPEDLTAYKRLSRPTAKGIFGNLHMWFHASHGRPVEKNYTDLCNFLDVTPYAMLSKIRSTMGKSLDELVGIRYLANWNIEPMSTKHGYKIILFAGEELLRVLALSQKKSLPTGSGSGSELSASQKAALDVLVEEGILPAKAQELVRSYDPELMITQIEYARSQIENARERNKFSNPPGFIIYSIEKALPVPADFVSSVKKREMAAVEESNKEKLRQETNRQIEYHNWVQTVVNTEIEARFPGEVLGKKIRSIIAHRRPIDEYFQRLGGEKLQNLAMQYLVKEVKDEMLLPRFEDWSLNRKQGDLFE